MQEWKVEEQAKLNVNTADPAAVRIYLLSADDDAEAEEEAEVYATISCPDGTLTVEDDAHIYGSFIGQELQLEEGGAYHQDLKPASPAGGVAAYVVRWAEQD